jgi:hypothetical protein
VAPAETPRPLGTRRPPEPLACVYRCLFYNIHLGQGHGVTNVFKGFLYFRFSKITGRIDPAEAGLDLRSKFDRRQAPTGARQDNELAYLFELTGASAFNFLFWRTKIIKRRGLFLANRIVIEPDLLFFLLFW